jgi:type VI secretion system Hcp family effector
MNLGVFVAGRWKLVLVVAILAIAIPAIASDNIFVSVPNAPGDVTTVPFAGQIQALSISTGFSNGATGRTMAPITITKVVDKSTPKLIDIGSKNTLVSSILISQTVTTNTSTTVTYMTLKLSNARIISWNLVDTDGGEAIEQISFSADSVGVEYTTVNANGTLGTKAAASFSAVSK